MTNTKRQRGAPKKSKTADARVEIRCTPDEKKRWEEKADKAGMKTSAWLKKLANEAEG